VCFLLAPERDTGSQLSTSHIQEEVRGGEIFILQNIMFRYNRSATYVTEYCCHLFSKTYRDNSVTQNRNIQNNEIFERDVQCLNCLSIKMLFTLIMRVNSQNITFLFQNYF